MAKQKVYVQKSYIFELEMDTSLIDPNEFVTQFQDMLEVDADMKPVSVQYMVEDSEWVEIHDT